jgi:TonB family protein
VVQVNANSGLRQALALSVAGHLLLVGGLLLAVRPEVRTAPVVVRLLNLEAPPAFAPVEGRLDGPGVTEAKPALGPQRLPQRRPRRLALAQAGALSFEPKERTPLPGPAADGDAAVSGGDASRVEAVAAARSEGGPASVRGTGVGGVSQERLGELHRRLAEAAERCYPAAARRFRLRGEVMLHFCLDAAGATTALGLEGSTGSPLLNRSALECVVPGAQPLSGFEGCFLVPVRFGG